jgi:magnesium and cobalt exporter, CNNM family
MNVELIILFFGLVLLILASGFFSSSEVALFSLSPMKVKAYRQDEDPKKNLISKLLSRPRDLLVTVFIMNTIVNILLQNVASDMFGRFAGWGLKVGVPLVLTLVFGEIIPKNFGLKYNSWLSYRVINGINFFQNMMSPIRRFVITVTTPVSRILFFYLRKADPISKEELKHTLETSESHGVLSTDESEFIKGYINLHEATVKEVMRPKSDILFFDISDPLTKLVHLFVDQQCSRIPVCDGELDKVLGVMTAKQYFTFNERMKDGSSLRPYLQKPFFVPENIPAKILFKKFTESNEHFSLVVDEYGSICGLITTEDICELVVGEIQDLRDPNQAYTRAGANEIIAGGRLELSEFTSIFHIELPNPNNLVTLGGWLMEQMGDVPKSGTKFETETFLFHVLAADPNRVRRIYVRKKVV